MVIETRQSKATTPEDNSIFPKRKRRAASGGIQTRDVLRTRQTLYQLSHCTCTCVITDNVPCPKPSLVVHDGLTPEELSLDWNKIAFQNAF